MHYNRKEVTSIFYVRYIFYFLRDMSTNFRKGLTWYISLLEQISENYSDLLSVCVDNYIEMEQYHLWQMTHFNSHASFGDTFSYHIYCTMFLKVW